MTAKLGRLVTCLRKEVCTYLLPPPEITQSTHLFSLVVPTVHYPEKNTSAHIVMECLILNSQLDIGQDYDHAQTRNNPPAFASMTD